MNIEYQNMRSSCKGLNIEFQIRFPSDLRQAIAVTRDNLADGTISMSLLAGIANHRFNSHLRESPHTSGRGIWYKYS